MLLEELTTQALLRRDAPPLLLAFDSLDAEGRLLIRCSGELDMATTEQLEREILGAAARGCSEVTLDLRRLGFIDCRGLRALLSLSCAAEADGWSFRLDYADDGPLPRLLELTGTTGRFTRAA